MKIIFLGPPASGKGTVSEKLETDFQLEHISAGALLREEVKKGTTIGNNIKDVIEKGNLVPDQLVTEIIKLDVNKKKNYILDGFPRTIKQAEAIENLDIDLVIYLEVPKDVIVERFAGRRVCTQGNHGYHLKYLPPKMKGVCDIDGSPLILRKDDTPEVVKDRFKIYYKLTKPLIDYYKQKGVLVTVNGAPAPNVVYESVKKVIQGKLKQP